MDRSPTSLSERQKVCLRLVGQGLTSKEIALETGLTPQTVDTYIKSAMAKLAASNRRDAARALAEHEVPQQSGSPSAAVATAPQFLDLDGAAGRKGLTRLLVPPPIGGRTNDLTGAQRTSAILRVAVTAAVVVAALMLFLAGVLMTFR